MTTDSLLSKLRSYSREQLDAIALKRGVLFPASISDEAVTGSHKGYKLRRIYRTQSHHYGCYILKGVTADAINFVATGELRYLTMELGATPEVGEAILNSQSRRQYGHEFDVLDYVIKHHANKAWGKLSSGIYTTALSTQLARRRSWMAKHGLPAWTGLENRWRTVVEMCIAVNKTLTKGE